MSSQVPDDLNTAITKHVMSLDNDVKRSILTQHLNTLQSYARRLFLDSESLSKDEVVDKQIRVREFWSIGKSQGYSERGLVKMLYRSIFAVKPGCTCLICRTVTNQQIRQ